jgi:predicted permease
MGALTNLGLALAVNLSVIIFGYLLSRFRVFSDESKRGIGHLVGMVSLPCLLFLSMARLDLGSIDWLVVLVIFLGKFTAFAVGGAVAVIRDRSWNGVKIAGIQVRVLRGGGAVFFFVLVFFFFFF